MRHRINFRYIFVEAIRIEPHVISTQDFDDKYYALAAQLKVHGIAVHT